MLRMDQVHVVRHKVLVEGLPVRQVARELGISRNTVKRYLTRPAPVRVESRPRLKPVREKAQPRIEALLAQSPSWTGGKQRLTATRLHAMLSAEGLKVGATVVKEVVAEWKRRRREVFVPLVYAPGELAEVDFFEVLLDLAGKRQKAWMFLLRLMHSGRDFACLYLRQDQTSFLDGHVRAFEHFGAVPQRIAYDNLRAAVKKILAGSERALAPRFEALASHYLFEPSFCRPRTGHDKGGVEARGKGIRTQHLVPIPVGDDLEGIRCTLQARLDAAFSAKVEALTRFDEDRGSMLPLPHHRFRACSTHVLGVSRRSLVCAEGVVYSAPCAWADLEVTVHVGADLVEIVGPDGIARHARGRFGERVIDYRHYLRELATKPQAVRQVAAPLIRDLGEPFGAAWRSLVDAHGPKQAARIFAKVLGHVETRGIVAVAHLLERALVRSEPVLLALAPAVPTQNPLEVTLLPEALRGAEVVSGRAADYDELLGGGRL
jgi:transposase